MIKSLFIAILITSISIFFISCSKKRGCTDIVSLSYDQEAEEMDESCEYGGDGGTLSFDVIPISVHPIISKPG